MLVQVDESGRDLLAGRIHPARERECGLPQGDNLPAQDAHIAHGVEGGLRIDDVAAVNDNIIALLRACSRRAEIRQPNREQTDLNSTKQDMVPGFWPVQGCSEPLLWVSRGARI